MGQSQNGWPLDPGLRDYTVPGTSVRLTLVADNDAATLLVVCAFLFNKLVSPLQSSQSGGYDQRPIGALGGTTSNHRSGTAIDLNWTLFPQGPDSMSAQQKATCRGIVALCGGTVRWGGDYGGGSLLDQMHFEINTTDRAAIRNVVAQIKAAATKPATPATPTTPATPAVPSSALPEIGKAISTPAGLGATPTTKGSAPKAAAPVELPKIGAVTAAAAIKLTRAPYVTPGNRLVDVRVAGTHLRADIIKAVTEASMSFSCKQIGQFSLTIIDSPDAEILNSGLLDIGTPLDFGDQHMQIRSVDIAAGEGGIRVTVKARSRVIAVLKDSKVHRGRGSWGEVETAQWVTDRCREGGAAGVVVQPGLGTHLWTRQESDQVESTWEVMQRRATELGAWCWEAENVITFAKPSWLVARPVRTEWPLEWKGHGTYSPGMDGAPRYSNSADGSTGEQLVVQLVSDDAEKARPGQVVTLAGRLKPANGKWIILAVDPPVTRTSAVKLTCARPVDPVPPKAT